jgi:hypothetical protein
MAVPWPADGYTNHIINTAPLPATPKPTRTENARSIIPSHCYNMRQINQGRAGQAASFPTFPSLEQHTATNNQAGKQTGRQATQYYRKEHMTFKVSVYLRSRQH